MTEEEFDAAVSLRWGEDFAAWVSDDLTDQVVIEWFETGNPWKRPKAVYAARMMWRARVFGHERGGV